MGVLKHGQGLATVQLYRELGRQVVKTGVALQRIEDLRSQWASVDAQVAINPRRRTEHQVAHIVTRRRARAQSSRQQAVDQPPMFVADPAYLQVGTIGRLDHPAGETLGSIGDRHGLGGADRPTIQLDPADTAVQRLHDTQQPRAGRGA
ncbi:hypothetical protein D3C78_1077100 [compost metagenome]